MKIHEKVATARDVQKRTLVEVARAAGIDDIHLGRFERGERGMSSDKIDRLLKVLGIELHGADEHGGSPHSAEDISTVG